MGAVRRAVLGVALLALAAGCHSSHPPPATRPAGGPANDGAVSPAAQSAAVPIAYGGRLSPCVLTPDTLGEILGEAQRIAGADRRVWFVLVLYSRAGSSGSRNYETVVYFTPEETTPRLRKGRYVHVSSWNSAMRSMLGAASSQPDEPAADRLLHYVQVSAAGQIFGPDLPAPPLPLLPFRAEGLSDQEIVELADCVHAGSWPVQSLGATGSMTVGVGADVDPLLPIRWMRRDGEGVQIETGWREGLVAGMGQRFTVKKSAAGWMLAGSVTGWVS